MPAEPTIPRIAPLVGFEGTEIDIDFYLTTIYDDVSRAQQELPSLMESINELREHYQEQRDNAKKDLKVAEATAYFDLKGSGDGNYQANYQLKPTEEGIKMAIVLDPEVRRLEGEVSRLSALVGRLSGTIVSIQSKIELLRSSEATRRRAFEDTTRD